MLRVTVGGQQKQKNLVDLNFVNPIKIALFKNKFFDYILYYLYIIWFISNILPGSLKRML